MKKIVSFIVVLLLFSYFSPGSLLIFSSRGEGTGLGVSITYDMVVKGHGGSIQVNGKDREGSEFVILLPLNTTII